jgi:hypothetical protein
MFLLCGVFCTSSFERAKSTIKLTKIAMSGDIRTANKAGATEPGVPSKPNWIAIGFDSPVCARVKTASANMKTRLIFRHRNTSLFFVIPRFPVSRPRQRLLQFRQVLTARWNVNLRSLPCSWVRTARLHSCR